MTPSSSFWIRISTAVCHCRRYFSSKSDVEQLTKVLASMPKDPKAAKELRTQRINAKLKDAKKSKPRPAEITLWVLGNGGPGNPRSLYVTTDQTR